MERNKLDCCLCRVAMGQMIYPHLFLISHAPKGSVADFWDPQIESWHLDFEDF